MSDLKTLKDIDSFDCWSDESHQKDLEFVTLDNLKQEALKWVKEFDHDLKRYREDAKYHQEINMLCIKQGVDVRNWKTREQNQILWIKYFFNITEEDLK